MPKLVVIRNTVEYYGFFNEPAFDLMGDIRALIKLLYETFSRYGVSLSSFRIDSDAQEISATAAVVRLGSRGIYKFRFDQAQAILNDFSTEQLAQFFNVIQVGDEHLRVAIPALSFKTHAFFYNSHCNLSEGTSIDFLRGLPQRDLPIPDKDLGTGLILNWRDLNIGADIALTVDHSLQVKNGIFINYRVLIDRDQVEFIPLAVNAQSMLYATLAKLGLEFDEDIQV